MDVELIHKPGRDNLVSDALSRREEFITPRILMLVEDELDDVEKKFLDDVREGMKQDEDAITNNRFFDARGSKKNPPGGRRIKNLRRKNDLHYFKQTRLYIPEVELKKCLLHEFHDTPLAGIREFEPRWRNSKRDTFGRVWAWTSKTTSRRVSSAKCRSTRHNPRSES